MKTKGLNSVKYVTLLLFVLLIGTACSSDDPVKDFNETQWNIVNVNIRENDWKWNQNTARYEVVVNLPELTEFIYEKGAQLGYVFIGEKGVNEVQKSLPFVHTYSEEDTTTGDVVIYTETISCDFQFGNPSTVAFYIQASDLARVDNLLADYNFRIVLIW